MGQYFAYNAIKTEAFFWCPILKVTSKGLVVMRFDLYLELYLVYVVMYIAVFTISNSSSDFSFWRWHQKALYLMFFLTTCVIVMRIAAYTISNSRLPRSTVSAASTWLGLNQGSSSIEWNCSTHSVTPLISHIFSGSFLH